MNNEIFICKRCGNKISFIYFDQELQICADCLCYELNKEQKGLKWNQKRTKNSIG
jgi:ribosomal protein L37E